MLKNILNILCCPICKGKLDLEIKKEDTQSIIDGTLYCDNCNKKYTIENSIPNLMSHDVISFLKKEYIFLNEPLDIYRGKKWSNH